eukprot:GILI01029531.1.p1 GENE.GILI01029531.1~~GILI01029531.1.p1  ORF type:complete len:284 (-),score=5.77 GILI01029531.1:32-883(-)
MKEEIYRIICSRLTHRTEIEKLAEEYDSSYNTLVSIYSQKYQESIRRTHNFHKRPENVAIYQQRYERGESIYDIAESIHFSPYLLARIILESKCSLSKPLLSEYIRNPSIIPDPRLREEVQTCIEEDLNYSPYVDKMKRIIGLEYEYVLLEKLKGRGIPFQSEEDLRMEGSYKTPDVKLEVPILVKGRVVNWIESKAMFGDAYNFSRHLTEQLRQYVNRFGPGMVIYWFDFIESLNTDKDILLVNDLPEDIITFHSLYGQSSNCSNHQSLANSITQTSNTHPS